VNKLLGKPIFTLREAEALYKYRQVGIGPLTSPER
jgi:hypothetical protein